MRRVRSLLLLLGLVLLGVLLVRIDLRPVLYQVRSLSWGLLLLFSRAGLPRFWIPADGDTPFEDAFYLFLLFYLFAWLVKPSI